MALSKLERRTRIKHRIRKIINGTATKPRLSVFRSNKEIYAQIIDDVNGVTLASVSSRDKEVSANTKAEAAAAVGKAIAELATKAGVEIGVASTKAFTTQLIALYALAISIGKTKKLIKSSSEKQKPIRFIDSINFIFCYFLHTRRVCT